MNLFQTVRQKYLALSLLVAGASLISSRAVADNISFNFDGVQATFSDVAPGLVTLQLSALDASGSGLSGLYFNLNPNLSPDSLVFTKTSASGTFTDPVIQADADAFKADAGGKYDIKVAFTDPNFRPVDTITYNISGISGLTVNDFDFTCTASAGGKQAPGIANIICGNQSTWTTPTSFSLDATVDAPDATQTVALFAFTLLGIEAVRRNKANFKLQRCPVKR